MDCNFTKLHQVRNSSGATIGQSASGSHTYSWSPTTGLDDATASNPTSAPPSSTNGILYSADAAFGSGDALSGGYVVYKNTTELQLV